MMKLTMHYATSVFNFHYAALLCHIQNCHIACDYDLTCILFICVDNKIFRGDMEGV